MAQRPELEALASLLFGGGIRGGGGLSDILGAALRQRRGQSGLSASLGDALGMRLAGVATIGPDGVKFHNMEEDEDEDATKHALVGKMMSECDFGDFKPTEHAWTPLPGEVPHFATTARNVDNEDQPRDIHPWVLANLEPTEERPNKNLWLLWSLCPSSRESNCLPLKADTEERAKFLANTLLDVMSGQLDGEEVSEMLVRGRPRRAKKQKPAPAPTAPQADEVDRGPAAAT